MQYSPANTVMIKAVRKAGRLLSRDFGEVENLQVSRKGPEEFVISAAQKAEKTIIDELAAARPDYGFQTAGRGAIAGVDPKQRWIVQALEGSINFMHSIPMFAVSVALEREGMLNASVIYNPISDELFVAQRGAGCYLNDRRLRVAGRRHLSEAVIAMGAPGPGKQGQEQFPEALTPIMHRVAAIRQTGTPSLDLAWVAGGRFDGLVQSGLQMWDLAPGALMIQEAGALITDLDGANAMLSKGEVVASNEGLHPSLLGLSQALRSV